MPLPLPFLFLPAVLLLPELLGAGSLPQPHDLAITQGYATVIHEALVVSCSCRQQCDFFLGRMAAAGGVSVPSPAPTQIEPLPVPWVAVAVVLPHFPALRQ